MTEQAKISKSARAAKYGEMQVCGRCNGTGFTNYRPQFGTCYKCFGEGVHIKSDPNKPEVIVNYIVKDANGIIRKVNPNDKGCKVSSELWVNDTFNYTPFLATKPIEVTILAKYKKVNYKDGKTEEKYSNQFSELLKLCL